MNLKNKMLGAIGFAHLAGIGKAGAAKAADDDKDKSGSDDADLEDEEPGDTEQDREDGDSNEPKNKKGKKAEDDKDDESADDDNKEYDDSDSDEPKNKKGKNAEDDEDSDEEMRGNSAAAKARRRERARCAAIFADKSAARNPVLAANLAFNTSMSRKEALAVLRSTPAAATGRERQNPDLSTDARVTHQGGGKSAADRMAARMAKAAGKK